MARIVSINRPSEGAAGAVACVCCICGRIGATLADLDGPPFVAYYHSACLPGDDRTWDGKPLEHDNA